MGHINGNEKQRKRKKHGEQISAHQQKQDNSSQDAFRNRLGSKTDHLFLEHMHPMNYRDSFTRNEAANEWQEKGKNEREKTKRVKKKKQLQNHHMQTVTEEEPQQQFKPS